MTAEYEDPFKTDDERKREKEILESWVQHLPKREFRAGINGLKQLEEMNERIPNNHRNNAI